MIQKLIAVYLKTDELHIIGYNIVRKDGNRHGGCVVLYICDNIPFLERID